MVQPHRGSETRRLYLYPIWRQVAPAGLNLQFVAAGFSLRCGRAARSETRRLKPAATLKPTTAHWPSSFAPKRHRLQFVASASHAVLLGDLAKQSSLLLDQQEQEGDAEKGAQRNGDSLQHC